MPKNNIIIFDYSIYYFAQLRVLYWNYQIGKSKIPFCVIALKDKTELVGKLNLVIEEWNYGNI